MPLPFSGKRQPEVDAPLAPRSRAKSSAAVQKAAIEDSLSEYQLPSIGNRERALPIRQGDLTRLLLAEPGLSSVEQAQLTAFGRILGATLHSDFYERLRELKELYAPIDPDSDYVNLPGHTRVVTGRSDEDFLVPLEATLDRANYRRLDLQIIEEAVTASNEMGLTYVPDFSLFEHLRVYVRGYTQVERTCRNVRTRFFKQTVHLDAYQRLVIALKFKPKRELGPYVRSDVVYLRMFKDVPHVDMEMHLPEQGTKVKMRWIDKAQIASPLALGIPTLAFKILLGLTTPFALGALIAPISAGVNSFFGFHRAKRKHLAAMIQRLYYLTLANNASVLTRLIDTAEDEDYKEAFLAYFFLWRAIEEPSPLGIRRLDDRIEAFLNQKTGIAIDFEIGDALTKLFRLGLAKRDAQGKLRAIPLDEAIVKLESHWKESPPWRAPLAPAVREPIVEASP